MKKLILEADKSIPLEIPKGYYVFVQLTTMAAFKFRVALRDKDSKKEYLSIERRGTNPIPPEYRFVKNEADESELYIDVPQSNRLDIRWEVLELFDDKNQLINRTYVFAGEDSYDYDYNDMCLTITILQTAD